MTPRETKLHEQLQKDLKQLKLTSILEQYSDLLDEAARKNTSTLEVLSILIGGEAAAQSDRAMQRRIAQARLPRRKTLEDYNFEFPKKIPKHTIVF